MGREEQTCAEMSCFLFYFIFFSLFQLESLTCHKGAENYNFLLLFCHDRKWETAESKCKTDAELCKLCKCRIFLHSFCCFGMRNSFFPN